jgi:hypothetical protein
MNILGTSAFHGDASVALIKSRQLAVAMREEQVIRPSEALACYLKTRTDVLALGNWILTRPPQTTGTTSVVPSA